MKVFFVPIAPRQSGHFRLYQSVLKSENVKSGQDGLTAYLLTIALPWWRCNSHHDILIQTKKKKVKVTLINLMKRIYFDKNLFGEKH